jgi:Rieske Fe-S protein
MERDPQEVENPNLNRREFLLLVGVVVSNPKILEKTAPVSSAKRTVDAGPIGNYTSDGVYGAFSDQGFFVVRKAQKLQVLSAFCTHRRCRLMAESDRSFYCKCHGSTFDLGGKVTEGPAKRNLPVLASQVNERDHLIVTVP